MSDAIFLWVGAAALTWTAAARGADDGFAVLQRHCVECHGPLKQSGKLRLDSVEAAITGGRSGPAIVRGKSAESLAVARVLTDDAKKRMPKDADPLEAKDVEALKSWIDAGARAPASASARVSFTPRPEALPKTYAPSFCVAGDPTRPRLAVGRGTEVDVREVGDSETRTLFTLSGHEDLVQSIAFSPDGKTIATGSYLRARTWDAETGKPKKELAPHADRVLVLAFSPDGSKLAAGGGSPTESGEVKVWDAAEGKPLWTATPHTDTVLALAWTPDGNSIVTGGADRVTYVLEAATGKVVRRLEGHTHHVLAVAVSPDGKQLASAGADNAVRIWDLEKGEYVHSLKGHERPATAVAFHGGGKYVASAGGDGVARFWEWQSKNQRFTLGESKGYIQGACFLAGEKLYAVVEQDGGVRVYDVEKRKQK